MIVQLVRRSTENAKDAFQLLGLALSRPRFDGDAVARVRAQILASTLQQDDEDPADRRELRRSTPPIFTTIPTPIR